MPTDITRERLQSALAGRYAIERELGRGGMATVYLARDSKHDRLVALKLLDPDLGAVLGAERFLSEIRVTANLQHPNLLPLFDSGEADGLLFYVMPFVDGESLRQRMERERQLPVDDAVRIAVAVAAALDYAHRHGVIHRDLKPENILLHDGQAVVADFGIALAVSNAGGQRVTQTGLSLGTPQYMSPEQATGDRGIDSRTDIYSLGAVTYEMLTGEPPHTGATAQAVIARLMTEEPRPITAVRRSVPPHVEAAVSRALEKLPADRFATAADFVGAITGATPTPAVSSRGATLSSRAQHRDLLSQPRTLQMVAGIATIIAVVALSLLARGRAEPRRPARARFVLELPDSARMNRGPGSVALSPDGSMIAYVTRPPTAAVYVRRLDELTPRRVAGTEGAQAPRFSPDGRSIAFVVRNSLMKVPLDGGAPTPIVDSLSSYYFTWLEGGTILFTRDRKDGRDELWKVSDAGGPAVRLTTLESGEENHRMPGHLPGGKAAVFAIQLGPGATAPHELALVRVADGTITRLGIKGGTPRYADGFLCYIRGDRTMAAVPFDPDRLRVTGDPIPVAGASTADIAENGTMIYYPNSSALELVSVDRSGNARPLLRDARQYSYPRLSPDGKRLMVAIGPPPSGMEIWIADLGSGILSKLSPTAYNFPDEWTPDGRSVLWTHGADAPAIWSGTWDASAPPERILDRAQGARLLSSGKEVLTTVLGPNGRRELRIVPLPADTLHWSKPLELRRTPGFTGARPSPDGKWIAFVDEQAGLSEVFVYARSGGRYQISSGGGIEPVWSRDGKELFYRAPQREMMAAHLELGAEARVVRRDTLFPAGFAPGTVAANYDVTADGQHFIIPRPIAVSEWPIVTIGWTDELRERVKKASAP